MGSIARRDGDVRIRTAGVGSEPAIESLRSAGFTVEPLGDDVTRPAALKMLRSLMTKNLRTLAAETLLAARAYDLEAEALASIGSKFDGTTFDEWLVDALDGTRPTPSDGSANSRRFRRPLSASGFTHPPRKLR